MDITCQVWIEGCIFTFTPHAVNDVQLRITKGGDELVNITLAYIQVQELKKALEILS